MYIAAAAKILFTATQQFWKYEEQISMTAKQKSI